jgi:hypothetical protein
MESIISEMLICTEAHAATFLNAVCLIFTAVRIWNLTHVLLYYRALTSSFVSTLNLFRPFVHLPLARRVIATLTCHSSLNFKFLGLLTTKVKYQILVNISYSLLTKQRCQGVTFLSLFERKGKPSMWRWKKVNVYTCHIFSAVSINSQAN